MRPAAFSLRSRRKIFPPPVFPRAGRSESGRRGVLPGGSGRTEKRAEVKAGGEAPYRAEVGGRKTGRGSLCRAGREPIAERTYKGAAFCKTAGGRLTGAPRRRIIVMSCFSMTNITNEGPEWKRSTLDRVFKRGTRMEEIIARRQFDPLYIWLDIAFLLAGAGCCSGKRNT